MILKLIIQLKCMASYTGFLQAPAGAFRLWPWFLFGLSQTKLNFSIFSLGFVTENIQTFLKIIFQIIQNCLIEIKEEKTLKKCICMIRSKEKESEILYF